VADITGRHIEMDRDELRTVLNVDSIVDSRTNGGPAPASVLGDAEILQERLDGLTARMSAKRSELDRAAERLANEARRD
ncbi:MAG: hypothetical protein ACLFU3_06420, partial [Dichotomicrobium sp.]